jgi:hypothetical protein
MPRPYLLFQACAVGCVHLSIKPVSWPAHEAAVNNIFDFNFADFWIARTRIHLRGRTCGPIPSNQ